MMGREGPFIVLFCLPVVLALWSETEDNKPKKNNNSDGQHESTLKEAW